MSLLTLTSLHCCQTQQAAGRLPQALHALLPEDHVNSQQACRAGLIASTRPGKVTFVTYIASRVCHVATHTYHSVVLYKHAPV